MSLSLHPRAPPARNTPPSDIGPRRAGYRTCARARVSPCDCMRGPCFVCLHAGSESRLYICRHRFHHLIMHVLSLFTRTSSTGSSDPSQPPLERPPMVPLRHRRGSSRTTLPSRHSTRPRTTARHRTSPTSPNAPSGFPSPPTGPSEASRHLLRRSCSRQGSAMLSPRRHRRSSRRFRRRSCSRPTVSGSLQACLPKCALPSRRATTRASPTATSSRKMSSLLRRRAPPRSAAASSASSPTLVLLPRRLRARTLNVAVDVSLPCNRPLPPPFPLKTEHIPFSVLSLHGRRVPQ